MVKVGFIVPGAGGSGGVGGTDDHNALSNRNLQNQHIIESITGLRDELNGLKVVNFSFNNLSGIMISNPKQQDVLYITKDNKAYRYNGTDYVELFKYADNPIISVTQDETKTKLIVTYYNGTKNEFEVVSSIPDTSYKKPEDGIPREDLNSEINILLEGLEEHLSDENLHVSLEDRINWDNKYTKSALGIPKSDLTLEVREALDAVTEHPENLGIHVTQSDKNRWNAQYTKPSNGIPKSDLSDNVKKSLDLADTAIQSDDLLDSLQNHNTSSSSHMDIRSLITLLESKVNTGMTLADIISEINEHDKSIVSHEDIREILQNMIGTPQWDPETYTLTFTSNDGIETVINLGLDSLTGGISYDSDTKELIIIQDDTEIRISILDLVKDYIGSTNSYIQTVIDGNIIKVTLLNNSITEDKLNPNLLFKINKINDKAEINDSVASEDTTYSSSKIDNLFANFTGGGGSGEVVSVTKSTGETLIDVDNIDPQNPRIKSTVALRNHINNADDTKLHLSFADNKYRFSNGKEVKNWDDTVAYIDEVIGDIGSVLDQIIGKQL